MYELFQYSIEKEAWNSTGRKNIGKADKYLGGIQYFDIVLKKQKRLTFKMSSQF